MLLVTRKNIYFLLNVIGGVGTGDGDGCLGQTLVVVRLRVK